jgi:alpha-D-ribose 1-methylphosphonate 5-phosphate C-P lyase
VSLDFDDYPFDPSKAPHPCALCGAEDTYLDEVITDDEGGRMFVCSDTDYGRRGMRPAPRALAGKLQRPFSCRKTARPAGVARRGGRCDVSRKDEGDRGMTPLLDVRR